MSMKNKNKQWKTIQEATVCVIIVLLLYAFNMVAKPKAWDGASLANKLRLEQSKPENVQDSQTYEIEENTKM